MRRASRWSDNKPHNIAEQMHTERVDIARVVTVAAVIGISIAVRTFGSLLLRHLFPIEEVVVFPSGGRT
jgi:hypothetical protein